MAGVGAYMLGGRRHACQGVLHDRDAGACVAGDTACPAGGTHPTGMHSCLNMQRVKNIASVSYQKTLAFISSSILFGVSIVSRGRIIETFDVELLDSDGSVEVLSRIS